MMNVKSIWPTVELGSLASFRNGLNYSKANFGKGLKVINVGDFGDRSTPAYDSLEEINPTGIFREESLLQKNDIIFVRSNGNRELIGRSMMLKENPPFPVSHSAFTIRARFESTQVRPEFFSYVFRTPLIRSVLSAHGNGANISNLNQDILSRLEVPLPSLKIQKRIASILSAYDDLIENNTRRIAILEEMARRIYEEWFVRFRFPGHEQVKMVESELGLIPEGGAVEKVASVVQRLPAGQTYKKESVAESGSVMVVDQSTSDYLGFHDLDVDHPASVNAPRIIFGDHTCKLKLMLRPFSVGPNTIPFVGTDGLDSIYVFQLVQGLVQTREYKRHWTDFSDKQVVLCEKELASSYGDAVRGFFHLAQVLDDKNRTLRATRDLLLPKLISGELDVSNPPEPEEAIAA